MTVTSWKSKYPIERSLASLLQSIPSQFSTSPTQLPIKTPGPSPGARILNQENQQINIKCSELETLKVGRLLHLRKVTHLTTLLEQKNAQNSEKMKPDQKLNDFGKQLENFLMLRQNAEILNFEIKNSSDQFLSEEELKVEIALWSGLGFKEEELFENFGAQSSRLGSSLARVNRMWAFCQLRLRYYEARKRRKDVLFLKDLISRKLNLIHKFFLNVYFKEIRRYSGDLGLEALVLSFERVIAHFKRKARGKNVEYKEEGEPGTDAESDGQGKESAHSEDPFGLDEGQINIFCNSWDKAKELEMLDFYRKNVFEFYLDQYTAFENSFVVSLLSRYFQEKLKLLQEDQVSDIFLILKRIVADLSTLASNLVQTRVEDIAYFQRAATEEPPTRQTDPDQDILQPQIDAIQSQIGKFVFNVFQKMFVRRILLDFGIGKLGEEDLPFERRYILDAFPEFSAYLLSLIFDILNDSREAEPFFVRQFNDFYFDQLGKDFFKLFAKDNKVDIIEDLLNRVEVDQQEYSKIHKSVNSSFEEVKEHCSYETFKEKYASLVALIKAGSMEASKEIFKSLSFLKYLKIYIQSMAKIFASRETGDSLEKPMRELVDLLCKCRVLVKRVSQFMEHKYIKIVKTEDSPSDNPALSDSFDAEAVETTSTKNWGSLELLDHSKKWFALVFGKVILEIFLERESDIGFLERGAVDFQDFLNRLMAEETDDAVLGRVDQWKRQNKSEKILLRDIVVVLFL